MSFLKLALVAMVLWAPPAKAMSYKKLTLEQRVCGAEVIAIGALSDIDINAVTLAYKKGSPAGTIFFDVAKIHEAQILKGDEISKSELHVIYQSERRPEGGELHYAGRPHSSGEHGIWYLRRDALTGFYKVLDPYSPSPITEAEEIQKLLKKGKCGRKA